MLETTIVLRPGVTNASVSVAQDSGVPLILQVPVAFLPEILRRGIMTPEEAYQGAAAGNIAGRAITPSEWKVNLFPDNPYALFESTPGGNGTTIAVRGYEPHTRTLTWRRDGRSGSGKGLLFRLPKTLWVSLWKSKRLAQAWVFTIADSNPWPHNINDENRILHPWAAGNVFEDGRVCWGSAPAVSFGTDGVNTINQNFYGSLFNDHTSRINLSEEFRWEGEAVAMNRHHFSLEGMWKQTTAGKKGTEKVGDVLHDQEYTRSLVQVITAAAGS